MGKRYFFLLAALYAWSIKPEEIGHECGLALVRLRKPLSYYQHTHGDYAWGARKLCALIEEQRNRGQDGAGMAVMKFDMPPGELYLLRHRNDQANAVDALLETVFKIVSTVPTKADSRSEIALKQENELLGEIYLGHIRYGTHSNNSLRCCQPYICKNSVASKNFALAGNFNMTNSQELCGQLVSYGLTPTSISDTQIILELISYYLKREHIFLAEQHAAHKGKELADLITQELDMVRVLSNACRSWDGGYVFAGILGNGDAFICRDPAGIRPGFFYIDDEVIAAASERTALMTVFNVDPDRIQTLEPGHVLIIKRDGAYAHQQFTHLLPVRQCSFERIYFSRSNDPAIYNERKLLGKNLAPRVMEVLGDDIENALFAYVPNSSESAFIGLTQELARISSHPIRAEKLIHKNQRLRTFIAHDQGRRNLVARLYSMTRGIVQPHNTLVVIDDSIVRGTTLRESLIKELAQLNPKRIIFISSAPPVMYPDCYGIDMSQIGKFIAFQAVVALAKEQRKELLLEQIKDACLAQAEWQPDLMVNYVRSLYQQFSLEEIAAKICQLVRPADLAWPGDIQIIYQTIDGLHNAMPEYTGDWYFTGNYPTPGGYKVLNTSYLNWYNGLDGRAY